MSGRWVWGPVLVLLVLAPFLVGEYGTTLLSKVLALGVLAVSVAVLTGHAGLPTLGQVAPYAVGAYTAALLGRAGVDVGVVQLGAALSAGAAFAAATGALVVRTRGVTALMVTLAVGELTATAAGRWKEVTGGTDGLAGIPPVRPLWGMAPLDSDQAVYWYLLAAAVLAVGATTALLRSPAGALLAGCRDHEVRMRASGHPVTRYLFTAHVAAGALAGVGGALLVTGQAYVSPGDAGFDVSALVLLAVVIGGERSVAGALLGAGLIVATRDWLAGPLPEHGPLLLGVLFVLTVYLLPDGMAGLGARWRSLPRGEAGLARRPEPEVDR